MTRILVVDNYDSFVFTIVGYLQQLGAECDVVRNDAVTPESGAAYEGVLISPGPGTPEHAGHSMLMIESCKVREQPMLGICLGHQALAVVEGAVVDRAPELLHGKTSQIRHNGTGVFAGIPDPFVATRYHSLSVDPATLPDTLVANAYTESGVIMGIQHVELPLVGVQFHPESILTQGGYRLLANWLYMCGLTSAVAASQGLSPLVTATT